MNKIKIDGGGYLDTTLELTLLEILAVVNHWYLKEEPNIFQNEQGHDLEEVVERDIDSLYNLNNK